MPSARPGLRTLLEGRSPFEGPRARLLAGRLGMILLLASLGTLFAASVLGYVIIRLRSPEWPDDLPPLPGLMWLSTAVLLASSGTMAIAQVAARAGLPRRVGAALGLTLVLAVGFLLLQAVCWWQWLDEVGARWDRSEAYRLALSGFYVFTGVHGLHVLGGLVALVYVAGRARAGRYSAGHHPGVQFAAMYWHFLDVVWLALFATLLIAG